MLKMGHSKLHVVTMVSNPVRYEVRYRLYKQFEERCRAAGVNLITVEVAFGDRPFEITEADNLNHVQLRTWFELWHKENALNIGIQHLTREYPDWEYVAWLDSDVAFVRPDWSEEIVQQLQHFMMIQCFSYAVDLNPQYEPFHTHKGFIWNYLNGQPFHEGYVSWHPGYGWAARRETLEHMGGLIDTAILGSADRHMACSLIDRVDQSYHQDIHPNYKKEMLRWQDRAQKYIMKDIGYMPGMISHFWHGKKAQRGYKSRWKILVDNQFDPEVDLKKDPQGLWQLVVETPRQVKLRRDIQDYFRARNEDSIDM